MPVGNSPESSLPGGKYDHLRGRLLGDALLYGSVRIAGSLSTVALLAILARLLGPDDLGVYTIVVTTASLTSLLWFSWLSSAAFRYSAAHIEAGTLSEMRSLMTRGYFVLAGLLAILVFGMRTVGFLDLDKLSLSVFLPAVLVVVFAGPANAIADLYRVEGNRRSYSTTMIAIAVTPIVIVIAFAGRVADGLPLAVIAQSTAPILIVTVIGVAWCVRASFPRAIAKRTFREFFAYGWPLVGAGTCSWVLSVSDRYILGLLKSSQEVGIYTAGYQLGSAPILFLYAIVMTPMEPLLFRAHESIDRETAGALLGRALALLLGFLSLALLILVGEREILVQLAVGDRFAAAASVVPLAALGVGFLVVGMVLQQVFILNRDTKPVLRSLALASVLSVSLNTLLVPRFAIMGTAWVTIAAYGIFLAATIRAIRGAYPIVLPTKWLWGVAWATVAAESSLLITGHVFPSSPGRPLLEIGLAVISYGGVFALTSGHSLLEFLERLKGSNRGGKL